MPFLDSSASVWVLLPMCVLALAFGWYLDNIAQFLASRLLRLKYRVLKRGRDVVP